MSIKVVCCSKFFVLFSIFLFSGCAVHYKDNQGVDRYFGLMMVGVQQNSCVSIVNSRALGLNIDFTRASGGASIGYRNLTSAYLSEGIVNLSEDAGLISGRFDSGNKYCVED